MRHKTEHLHMDRKHSGFTMMELLLVIAILGVLFSLAVGGLLETRKKLRQQELDAKAEIIYAAAQNRVAELRAAGYGDKLTDDKNFELHKMSVLPADAVVDAENATLYYVTSQEKEDRTSLAGEILPQTCVDPELWGNHWLIEYNGDTGLVYAVFYSETEEIPTVGDSQTDIRRDLRNRAKRLSGGAKFGYYGGDITLGGKSYTLTPSLNIENKEELKVYMSCTSPNVGNGVYPGLKFDLTVQDVKTQKSKTISIQPRREGVDLYKAEFVLDSLADGGKNRFSALFPELTPGNNISVTLTVRASGTGDASANIIPKSVSQETNSLFAYESYQKNTLGKFTNDHKAYIAYRRHLQNLDTATSKVTTEITAGYLTTDLDFRKSSGTGVASFYTLKPITNDSLMTFTGKNQEGREEVYSIKNLYITGSADGGLFATFRGREISDLILTDTRIAGSVTNAGGVIGRALSNVTLRNCRVYQTGSQLGKYSSLYEVAQNANYRAGSFAGGLVGVVDSNAEVTILNSFAATTLSATRAAGGAVGLVQSGGKVLFQDSYTDCYLAANRTGGVVGQTGPGAAVTVRNFYTAGYQKAAVFAAGVVPEKTATVSMSNGYCAVSYEVGKGATVYTSAYPGSGSRVYAMELTNLTTGANTTVTVTDVSADSRVSGETLTKGEMVGNGKLDDNIFQAEQTGSTFAYNLLNQGLDNYPYPRLKGLYHYGDWEMTVQAINLVYYERYEDLTYGVYSPGFQLDDEKEIIGDGYGLLLTSKPTDGNFRITYNGNEQFIIATNGDTVYHAVTGLNGQTYHLLSVTPRVVKQNGDVTLDSTNYLAGKLQREENSFYSKVMLRHVDADRKEGRQYTYFLNPNFAKTVVASDILPETPGTVYLRTPRHLAALSEAYRDTTDTFWELFGNTGVASFTFSQERTLDFAGNYNWVLYANKEKPTSLAPIGQPSSPFAANYDGQCYEIQNLSIDSKNLHTGLFGHITGSGVVQNVLLVGDDHNKTVIYSARNSNLTVLQTTADQLAMGALAGYNGGRITNCAVSGYAAKVAGFSQSAAYVGGLVGINAGTIENCAVDTPELSLRFTSSTGRIGGLVGSNLASGSVTGCYSLGHIKVTENKNGNVRLAGFVGENYGSIARCYSGCALEAAGATTELYGFGQKNYGTATECYYIDGGTYSYMDGLYSFNASNNAYKENAAGEAITGYDLKNKTQELGMNSVAKAQTYYHTKTTTATNCYDYPGTVTLASGKAHFGNWPNQEKDLGTLGLFYWEYEQGGSNAGYHLYYLGTTQNGDGVQTFDGTNLCTHHDDGGVITQYGYGYFYHPTTENGSIETVSLQYDNEKFLVGNRNSEAEKALQKQLPQYQFVAYTTGIDTLRLKDADENGTWTLTYNGNSYTYSLCPFFAKAISLDSYTVGTQETKMPDDKPGYSEKRAYQVRSIQQLQYINWNYQTKNTTTSITGLKNESRWNPKNTENTCFPYLLCETTKNAGKTEIKPLYWSQTHDLDAAKESIGNFTPIGSMFDAKVKEKNSEADIAAFSSTYDGQSYAIKNVNIESDAECVGLFGITTGAKMENIVLYADQTCCGRIQVNGRKDGEWYCIGGLVGLAGHRNIQNSSYFKNCTVSGCTIIDNRNQYPGWGGGCVGGLVGATNMNLTNCTAVSTIQANMTYGGGEYTNCRVGGLVGSSKGTITNCYAGGKIERTVGSADANIWVGGLLGGIVLRNEGTLASVLGSTKGILTTVENSYSYVELPAKAWTIKAVHAIASNGELQLGKFAKVDEFNDKVKIVNCYALQSAVANSEDYKYCGAWQDSQFEGKTVNLNLQEPGNSLREIILENSRSPYLTYDQMEKEMKNWFGNGFGEVTTIDPDTGSGVGGKYSYPGTDGDLKYLNLPYPFPTVLTQGNINVHYGAWPKHGLYWETETGTIDLMVDRQAVTQTAADPAGETLLEKTPEQPDEAAQDGATQEESPQAEPLKQPETYVYRKQFNLKWIAVAGSTQPQGLTFQYYTEDNDPLKEKDSPVFEVLEERGSFTQAGTIYTAPITLEARRPGTVVVEARANNGQYTARLTVIVTAELNILLDETQRSVSVYEGESKTLSVTLQNSKGDPIQGLTAQQLTWTTPQTTVNASWAIQEDGEHPGQYTLTVTGGKAGTKKLTLKDQILTVRYTHDPQTAATFESNIRLQVEVKPSVILGIGSGNGLEAQADYCQVSVPYVRAAQRYEGQAPTDEDVKPLVLKNHPLYLYGTEDYTGLANFSVVAIDPMANRNPSVRLTIGGVVYSLVRKAPSIQGDPEDPADAPAEAEHALEPGQDLFVGDEYQLLLDQVTKDPQSGMDYRAMTLTNLDGNVPEEEWTLELLLTRTDDPREGESFYLIYKRPNTVSFCAPQEEGQEKKVLLTKRLAQGSGITPEELKIINQELQEQVKSDPGYYWKWSLEATPVKNEMLFPERTGISFVIQYDSNFEDSYIYGELEPQTLTYGNIQPEDSLRAISWHKPGMIFAGWYDAGSNGREAKLENGTLTLDGEPFVPKSLDQELTLYAHWTPMHYTVQIGKDGTPEAFTYGVPRDAWTPETPTEEKPGYTFGGWTYGKNQLLEPDIPWPQETYVLTEDGEAVILKEHWIPIPLNLTLQYEEKSVKVEWSIASQEGKLPKCPAEWLAGGTFDGWFLEETEITTVEQLLKALGEQQTATLTAHITPAPAQEETEKEAQTPMATPPQSETPEPGTLEDAGENAGDGDSGGDTSGADTPGNDMPEAGSPDPQPPEEETPQEESPEENT